MAVVRIIAGDFGGRRLAVPDQGTRPTSDRVRESLFNVVIARADLEGMRVLDLYAGSGALGLEALSRGAAHATFVESRRRAAGVIASNIASCGVEERTRVLTAAVDNVLRGRAAGDQYDLIMLDPPYDLDAEEVSKNLAVIGQGWLSGDGLVVVERASRGVSVRWPENLRVIVARNYGDTRLEVAAHV